MAQEAALHELHAALSRRAGVQSNGMTPASRSIWNLSGSSGS